MKKLTRKSIITIVTVLLLVVALGTATFAWITINNMASVRGMRMEVDTTNALQIEEETEIVEENFTNKIINPGNNQLKYLQPISSADGVKFYYTPNLITGVDGQGKLNSHAKIYEYEKDEFALLYDSVYTDLAAADKHVEGYAEYTFILKAYASTSDLGVYLTDLDFTFPDEDSAKAFRVAVLTKTLGADGKFADQPYVSHGIITFKEGEVGRSIKNNAEYLALGKKDAGEVKVSDTETIKQYVTNYGNVLFSEDGNAFFKDAKKANAYTLALATDADARIELGSETFLQKVEYVNAIGSNFDGSYYEFTTNQNHKVYGASQESANNTTYYYKDDLGQYVRQNRAFVFGATEDLDGNLPVDLGDGWFEYTTTEAKKVYAQVDNALTKDDATFAYKQGGNFVTELKPYEFLQNAETLDLASATEVKELNGVTYYKITTSLARDVYCVSETGNGPLFNGTKKDEVATEKDSYYDVVKEFDSSKALLELNEGETGYVLVTLRIWVEGEDQNCNNATFVGLNKEYTLNVDFGITAPTNKLYLK